MSNAFNDWADGRDRDSTLAPTVEPRTPDGNPTVAGDVEPAIPQGNFSATSSYSRVEWNVTIPTRALTPTTNREAQAAEPDGFLEVLSIVQRRGDTANGILAPDISGEMVPLAPRTYA